MSLLSTDQDRTKHKRWDIINFIVKLFDNPSYLEIGTSLGENYYNLNINNKECCDPYNGSNPHPPYTYNMPSDDAFEIIKNKNKKYDIIFIDGLHCGKQVYRDIKNSVCCLNKNGFIVLHDCNPPTHFHARLPHEKYPAYFSSPWNGNSYQGLVKYKFENPDVYVRVVDTDWGVGIIQPDIKEINDNNISLMDECVETEKDIVVDGVININNKYINWDFFSENRKEILNLIDVNEFISYIISKKKSLN